MGGMAGLFQDTEYDEYGLQKPAKSFTELGAEALAPEADDAWYEELGKGFGAIPVTLGGHFLDQMPIIGGPAMGPLNELAHGGEIQEYERQRAAAAAAAQGGGGDGEMCPADPAAPTYEWMAE